MAAAQDFSSVGFCEASMQRAYGLLQAAVDNGELLGAVLQVSRGGAVLPFTCGPGHRSHRTRDGGGFLRKTHGVNEGFHIASGRRTLPFFLHMVLKIAGGGD